MDEKKTFKKMRRFKQQLTEQECIDVLNQAPRGVMAVYGKEGYPYAFPMDYIYIDGKIYFHCAKEGHKLDAIDADNHASFCVMDDGFVNEGDWALNIKSIIIFGKVSRITDPDTSVQIVRKLALRYYKMPEDVEEEIKKSASRMQILEMSVDHMTGKLVNES